jgi:hypothetical protein
MLFLFQSARVQLVLLRPTERLGSQPRCRWFIFGFSQ